MKLVNLLSADMYRDGGSYSAEFETDDGLGYSVFLQRSKMPDEEGLHHRWLYKYRGFVKPANCKPVLTGSSEEQELLKRLKNFVAANSQENETYNFKRLCELIEYITLRESCFPFDIS